MTTLQIAAVLFTLVQAVVFYACPGRAFYSSYAFSIFLLRKMGVLTESAELSQLYGGWGLKKPTQKLNAALTFVLGILTVVFFGAWYSWFMIVFTLAFLFLSFGSLKGVAKEDRDYSIAYYA